MSSQRELMQWDRREAMKLMAVGAAGALIGGTTGSTAIAAPGAAPTSPQGAGFYRFKIGDIQAAVVSDGSFLFESAFPTFGADRTAAEVDKALDDAWMPKRNIVAHVNTLLLRTGKEVVLVDSGCGALFGPTTGKMPGNLERAGVKPGDVTAVIITHAHGDHVGGLLDADGKPAFPNARHFIHETELAFWSGPIPISRVRTPRRN